MANDGFWTGERKHDPMRQDRFRITLSDALGAPTFTWWAKSCDKPKINIPVLGKDEYYLGDNAPDVKPGEIVDFQPIVMTFIDPVQPSMSSDIISKLSDASGECFPRINGAKLKEVFGYVIIEQVDHEGNMLEKWSLNGAFPTSIDFGSLDYTSNDFVAITITWEYTSFDVETKFGAKIAGKRQNNKLTSFSSVLILDGGLG